MYKCLVCFETNTTEQWNDETTKFFGPGITCITKGTDEYYVCPSCGSFSPKCDIERVS